MFHIKYQVCRPTCTYRKKEQNCQTPTLHQISIQTLQKNIGAILTFVSVSLPSETLGAESNVIVYIHRTTNTFGASSAVEHFVR